MPLSPAPIQEPLSGIGGRATPIWIKWFDLARKLMHRAPTYNVVDLPAAATSGDLAFVPDEAGGPVLAFYDGANWRRCTDRAIVS